MITGDEKTIEEERKCGEFFVMRLNKSHDLSYIYGRDDENADADGFLISGSQKEHKIQIVWSESDLRKTEKKAPEKPEVFFNIDLELFDAISRSMKKKEAHYPEDIRKDTILLIWSDCATATNTEPLIEKLSKINTSFKGVYFVLLPLSEDRVRCPDDREAKMGYVLTIKSAFPDKQIKNCF